MLVCLLFLDFFKLEERAEMSVEGTTEAISAATCCRRVQGAIIVWQDNGKGKAWEE